MISAGTAAPRFFHALPLQQLARRQRRVVAKEPSIAGRQGAGQGLTIAPCGKCLDEACEAFKEPRRLDGIQVTGNVMGELVRENLRVSL